MTGKWKIPGWGAAQGQIREAIDFLCEGKTGTDRAEVIDELVALVKAIGRGEEPPLQANPLTERDEHQRESWARGAARAIVGGAMRAVENLPREDHTALLREIAKQSLWHIPNSHDEVRKLKDWLDIENIKQPHPYDPPPGRD
jgi:hypothetical protein